MPSCKECKFFVSGSIPRNSGDILTGDCRKNPPLAPNAAYRTWAAVRSSDWCGGFVSKEVKEAQKDQIEKYELRIKWLEMNAERSYKTYVKLSKHVKALTETIPDGLELARACKQRKVHKEWPALEHLIRQILESAGEGL